MHSEIGRRIRANGVEHNLTEIGDTALSKQQTDPETGNRVDTCKDQ